MLPPASSARVSSHRSRPTSHHAPAASPDPCPPRRATPLPTAPDREAPESGKHVRTSRPSVETPAYPRSRRRAVAAVPHNARAAAMRQPPSPPANPLSADWPTAHPLRELFATPHAPASGSEASALRAPQSKVPATTPPSTHPMRSPVPAPNSPAPASDSADRIPAAELAPPAGFPSPPSRPAPAPLQSLPATTPHPYLGYTPAAAGKSVRDCRHSRPEPTHHQ